MLTSSLLKLDLLILIFVLFCNSAIENIQHFFWECPDVDTIWKQTQRNLLKDCVNLTDRDIILGRVDVETRKYNFVILYAKYYIYICKWKECKPIYTGLINFLKYNRNIEETIATRNNNLEKCNKKWSTISM